MNANEFQEYLSDIADMTKRGVVGSPMLVGQQPVEWKFGEPESFPCFMCKRGRGEWMIKIRQGKVTVNVALCFECAELPVEEIAEFFLKGGRG